MKHLNPEATKVFKAIIALLGEQDHMKLDNSQGTFMPLSVEFLCGTSIGKVYSLTHWAGPYNGESFLPDWARNLLTWLFQQGIAHVHRWMYS